MRRQKFIVDPDLGDLEEMLANVQSQLENEIDEAKMPSITNIRESPRMVKRTSSFNKCNTLEFTRRPAPRPPLNRIYSEVNSGSQSLEYRNGDYRDLSQVNGKLRSSQSSLKDEMGSQSSFQSFRSEPAQRLSILSLPDSRSSKSLNGRGKTATLPRGYGASKKEWEEYWAQ